MTTRVLIMAPHFAPGFRAGGTLRSLVSIVDTAPSGVEAMVITSDRDLGDDTPYEIPTNQAVARGRHRVVYVRGNRARGIVGWARQARAFEPQVLYLNSLWNPWYSLLPLVFAMIGILQPHTVLVAPRGQLATSALSESAPKKRLIMWLWRLAVHRLPLSWHATDDSEAQLIQSRLPGRRPVYTSMDPVGLPRRATATNADPAGPLKIVFVGRLAPVKNVATMVSGVCRSGIEFHLSIVGPQEDPSHVDETKKAAAACGDQVTFTEALPHEDLLELLSEHHVMFFPTLGENFGHVIAESLSRSCPVVCGPVTPFTNVIQSGGGRIIDHTSEEAWQRETRRWAAMPRGERLRQHSHAGESYDRWIVSRDSVHVLSRFAD